MMLPAPESPRNPPRRGIGRAEVVVVVCVILLLAGIVLPLVYQSRTKARQEQVVDRFRTLGVHLHVYHDTYKSFPPGVRLAPTSDRRKPPPGVEPRDR